MSRYRYRLYSSLRWPGACCLAMMMVAPAAHALDVGYGIGYQGEYSNNIRLVQTDKEEEWINIPQFGLLLREDSSPNLELRVLSAIEHRNYRRDTYADETLGNVSAFANWAISPNRLNWVLENYYGQTAIRSADAATPDNRQNVNVFSTGPSLYPRLSARNSLEFGLRYGNYYIENADTDNDRYSAIARWLYEISSVTTASLNYDGQQVDNRNPLLYQDYSRHDVFFSIRKRGTAAQFLLDLGKTLIRPESGTDRDEALGRLIISRPTSAQAEVSFTALSRLLDSGDAVFAAGSTGITPVDLADTQGNRFYHVRELGVMYVRRRPLTSDVLHVYRQRTDYESSLLNERRLGGDFEIGYDITGLHHVVLYGNHRRTEYYGSSLLDRDSQGGVRFLYRLSRSITLALDGRYTQRHSNDQAREYDEARGILSLAYSSNPLLFETDRRERARASLGGI